MTTTRYFSLARHALVEALRTINFQPGEAVAIPALICRDVLGSLATVGARPLFYHVDEMLKPIDFPNDTGLRAVIAVNYFGFAQDLAPFNHYCSTTGAILIEDNAHGFLSADQTGQQLGTRSAMGITSIRKTIRIPDGAMLSINEPRLFDRIQDQLPMSTYSIYKFRLRRLFAIIERRFRIPILRLMRTISRTTRSLKTGSPLPTSSAASETEILQLSGPHRSSIHILDRLNRDLEITRRRKLFAQIHGALLGLSLTPLYPELPHGTVPYGYPFFSDESTIRDAKQKVAKYGVEIIRWPDLPDTIVQSAPYHYTNLWFVNFL